MSLMERTLNNSTARMWFGLFMILLVVSGMGGMFVFNTVLQSTVAMSKFTNEFDRVIEFCDQNISEQKKLLNRTAYCRMAKEFRDKGVIGSSVVDDSCFYDLNLSFT
jgi:hypothetical protein